MSERQLYLKKLHNKKLITTISQLSIIFLFFTTWEVLAHYNIINSFIFSSPSKIFNTIIELAHNGSLWLHILTTLKEVLVAFFLGISLGFIIAIILYEIPILGDILDPFLTIINSLPKVALGPLIIIISGANGKSIIIMALLINLIISIITIYNGFKETSVTKLKLFKTLQSSKFQTLTMLVIPNTYNTIISSLKINVSMTLIGLLPPVGEKTFFNKCYSRYLFHYHLL